MSPRQAAVFAALCREYALAERECDACEAASAAACERRVAARAAIDRFIDQGVALARMAEQELRGERRP